jgi:putative endonuclease
VPQRSSLGASREHPAAAPPDRPAGASPSPTAGKRPVPDARPALGRAGEDAALRSYETRGYRLVARNVRLAGCELDLVLRRGENLVFCEVKTRCGAALGAPEEAVDERKRTRLRRAAEIYLARHPARGDVRFDVACVLANGSGQLQVRTLEGAFRTW